MQTGSKTFVVIGLDRVPKQHEARKAHREAHRAYVLGHSIRPVSAAGMLDSDGSHCGSLYVFEAEAMDEVRAWAEEEPYIASGIYEMVAIREIDTSSPMWTFVSENLE